MIGETESSPMETSSEKNESLAAKRSRNRNKKIEDYEESIGLPPALPDRNECVWLTITGEEAAKMTPEAINEASTDLASYGFYIQRILSKERGILRWLDSRINLSIAGELNNYTGYYSHDQRRAVAIINNSYAKELEEMKINSQLKVDLLEGLTFQINQLCRVLMEKRRNHG